MTAQENERLAVVETKINDMVVKIDVQEKTIAAAMTAQKEAISIAMTASEKAIVKAEIANDLRFGGMDKGITDSIELINANIKTLTENQNLVTGAKTGVKEFIGYILAAITIIGFMIAQFIGRGV